MKRLISAVFFILLSLTLNAQSFERFVKECEEKADVCVIKAGIEDGKTHLMLINLGGTVDSLYAYFGTKNDLVLLISNVSLKQDNPKSVRASAFNFQKKELYRLILFRGEEATVYKRKALRKLTMSAEARKEIGL